MKRIVSFSLEENLDDELTRVANVLGWDKTEIVEKALRLIFDNPEFTKAVSNIEKIMNETEALQKGISGLERLKVEDDSRGKRNQK